MTAREHHLGEEIAVFLICDGCGRTLRAENLGLADFTAMWHAAQLVGWQGPDAAGGRHRCDACTATGWLRPRWRRNRGRHRFRRNRTAALNDQPR